MSSTTSKSRPGSSSRTGSNKVEPGKISSAFGGVYWGGDPNKASPKSLLSANKKVGSSTSAKSSKAAPEGGESPTSTIWEQEQADTRTPAEKMSFDKHVEISSQVDTQNITARSTAVFSDVAIQPNATDMDLEDELGEAADKVLCESFQKI